MKGVVVAVLGTQHCSELSAQSRKSNVVHTQPGQPADLCSLRRDTTPEEQFLSLSVLFHLVLLPCRDLSVWLLERTRDSLQGSPLPLQRTSLLQSRLAFFLFLDNLCVLKFLLFWLRLHDSLRASRRTCCFHSGFFICNKREKCCRKNPRGFCVASSL